MGKPKKQLHIEGTEPKSIKEVDTAAESYVGARDERMKKTEREDETKQALIGVMKKHGLTVYKDEEASPPLIVTVTPGKDQVKVTRAKDEEEGDEGGDDE